MHCMLGRPHILSVCFHMAFFVTVFLVWCLLTRTAVRSGHAAKNPDLMS